MGELIGELDAILRTIPAVCLVHCREGGGLENTPASLALSVRNLVNLVDLDESGLTITYSEAKERVRNSLLSAIQHSNWEAIRTYALAAQALGEVSKAP
jgi:hypothetical protein